MKVATVARVPSIGCPPALKLKRSCAASTQVRESPAGIGVADSSERNCGRRSSRGVTETTRAPGHPPCTTASMNCLTVVYGSAVQPGVEGAAP